MKRLLLLSLLLLTSCNFTTKVQEYDSPEDKARYEAIDRRTVKFLDRSETGLTPCLSAISNKYSTDLSIAVTCQEAVFLYRKYGGRPHLEPLYLTLIKDSDKVRANNLVDNLDKVEAKYTEIEERNKDNFYFNQIVQMQQFAQKAADASSTKVTEAKDVSGN